MNVVPHFFLVRSATPKDLIVQLPVPPVEEFPFVMEANTGTLTLVKLGEVNLLKGQKLKECTIESFLPRFPDGGYVRTKGEFKSPEFYINFLDEAQKNNIPLRLIVTGYDINQLVSVESFEYNYLTDYVDYTLELKEYKHFGIREVKIVTKTVVTETPTPSPKPTPKPEPKKETTTGSVQATPTSRQKTGFSVGDLVVCTGVYYATSYGDGGYGRFKSDYVGKISHIVASPRSGQSHPIHIVTPEGSHSTSHRRYWLGWVKESQLKHK